MSVVSDPPTSHEEAGQHACAHCNAAMEPDQEWCLECGSARTLIHPAPDWRAPVALVAGVVVLVLAGFALALTSLSTQANRITQTGARAAAPTSSTPTTAATTSRSTTPAASAKPESTPSGTIPGWPTGLSGWTVVLAQRRFQAKAKNVAREFQGAGISAGVLNSSRHPSMTPGFWIVFVGRYPSQSAAEAAAAKLRANGHKRAQAREVAPPGGI